MSVTLNQGSSRLWVEDGIVLPQHCQGGPCRMLAPPTIGQQLLFTRSCKIKGVEESLETYRNLSLKASEKLQEDIQDLNEEIHEKKIDRFFDKLNEMNEKNLWPRISVDVSCLKKSLSDCENGERSGFLLIYQKLNQFFNRQDVSRLKPEQLALIATFHQISNEYATIEKRNQQQLWKDVEEDLKSLEEKFSGCEGEEKNTVLTIYENLNNFFSQFDSAMLDSEQQAILDRFEALGKQNLKLIEEYHQNVHLTADALGALTSFEFYLNEISNQILSQEELNVIIHDYKSVLENIEKQSFFICLEVLSNVKERLGVIRERLSSFKISKSPTSVTHL